MVWEQCCGVSPKKKGRPGMVVSRVGCHCDHKIFMETLVFATFMRLDSLSYLVITATGYPAVELGPLLI